MTDAADPRRMIEVSSPWPKARKWTICEATDMLSLLRLARTAWHNLKTGNKTLWCDMTSIIIILHFSQQSGVWIRPQIEDTKLCQPRHEANLEQQLIVKNSDGQHPSNFVPSGRISGQNLQQLGSITENNLQVGLLQLSPLTQLQNFASFTGRWFPSPEIRQNDLKRGWHSPRYQQMCLPWCPVCPGWWCRSALGTSCPNKI